MALCRAALLNHEQGVGCSISGPIHEYANSFSSFDALKGTVNYLLDIALRLPIERNHIQMKG